MPPPDLRSLPWRAPATTTVLLARGSDARSLLHRISTRELADLPAGVARATAFCDYRGRLLHAAHAVGTEDGVLLLRDDAPGADLLAWVDRHVFREDCRVEDLAPRWALRQAWGPAASAWREARGLPVEACAPAGEGAWIVAAGPDLLWIAGEGSVLEPLLGPAAPGGTEEERARIRAARPAHGREVVERFNPYEVGLADRVHLAKGCYTGQEALQRMARYSGVRRQLARVSGPGPPPRPLPLEIRRGEDRGGWLTSGVALDGPTWIGLAVVPRAWAAGGGSIGGAPGQPPWNLELVEAPRPLGRFT